MEAEAIPGIERGLSAVGELLAAEGVEVGIVHDLIFLKLYAAADSGGPASVHFQDLLALRPTERELLAAAAWVRGQDPTPAFARILEQVIEHAREGIP
jgi:hypothetical protein